MNQDTQKIIAPAWRAAVAVFDRHGMEPPEEFFRAAFIPALEAGFKGAAEAVRECFGDNIAAHTSLAVAMLQVELMAIGAQAAKEWIEKHNPEANHENHQ